MRGRDQPPGGPRPLVEPIYQSTIFELTDASYQDITEAGGLNVDWYTRFRNPTVSEAADGIASLEGGEAGCMTSSGMAAIATTLLTLCGSGDRVVAARQVYGDTHDLLARDLSRLGITVEWVDVASVTAWQEAVRRPGVKAAYAETLSNPQLHLLDIPCIASAAHASGVPLVVDNTFASAYTIRPLDHGADIVINSVTKFLNGHSDVIAGHITGSRQMVLEFQRRVVTLGGCLDPHAAFLVSRGLKTFDLRLARQTESAATIAGFLESHPRVGRVIFPGLASYPQKGLADRLLPIDRRGAMVSFCVRGDDCAAVEVIRHLRLAREATSLGGVETLASTPHNSSHFSLTLEQRRSAGIEPGMIRLSVGVEPVESLMEDLDQALACLPT